MDSPQTLPQAGETRRPFVGERVTDERGRVLTFCTVNDAGVVEYSREGSYIGLFLERVPCLYAGFTTLKAWLSWPLVEGEAGS